MQHIQDIVTYHNRAPIMLFRSWLFKISILLWWSVWEATYQYSTSICFFKILSIVYFNGHFSFITPSNCVSGMVTIADHPPPFIAANDSDVMDIWWVPDRCAYLYKKYSFGIGAASPLSEVETRSYASNYPCTSISSKTEKSHSK